MYFLIQLHTEESFSVLQKIFRFCFSIPLKDVQKNNLVMIIMHTVLTMKKQNLKQPAESYVSTSTFSSVHRLNVTV